MPEKERHPKAVLRYVEDYLELVLELLKAKEKAKVEVVIEEEKAESLKIRVISIMPDGRRTEMIGEAPRLLLEEFLLLTPITARSPSRLIQPVFPVENKISTEILLQPPAETTYLLQLPMRVFLSDFRTTKISPISLPFISPGFQAWFRDVIKAINLLEQPGIITFTLKHLLRLVEIPLKLPSISEEVKANVKLPALTFEGLIMQHKIKAVFTEATKTLHDVAQAQKLKGIGLLELIMPEEREKFRRFLGASGEHVGEPLIIILPKSKDHVWYLFWIACRELYREARGAYPEPIVLLERGYEQWLEYTGRLAGKIVILYESYIKDEDKGWLKRRLQEAFSQGLGSLIIITEDVDKTKAFIEELCKPYIAKIVDIRAIPELSEILSRLARVLSSTFGVPYNEIRMIDELDGMVARIDRAYRDFLNDLLSSDYVAYVRRDVGERESEDHIAMKILAIKNLHEKLGIELEKIACTYEVGDKVIADVYVEEKALAIECETMLGTSPASLLKIFESVRKYVERDLTKSVNEIWVVIRNWPATLHLGDLFWVENVLRKELKQFDKKIKFFVPDIRMRSLKAIDDIVREIY